MERKNSKIRKEWFNMPKTKKHKKPKKPAKPKKPPKKSGSSGSLYDGVGSYC